MKVRATRGFTLIELLVVIAIIGILAAIILPALSNSKPSARDGQRVSQLRQIAYALELYFNTNGKYPECLYSSVCSNSLQGSAAMKIVPKDPQTDTAYSYTALGGGCTSYHLGASLEQIPNSTLLANDADKTVAAQGAALCGSSAAKFSGLSIGTGGAACATADAGNGTDNGTERCYDIFQ